MNDDKDLIIPTFWEAKKAWDKCVDDPVKTREILDLYFSDPVYKREAIKKIRLDLLSNLNALYRIRTKCSWVRSHILDLQENTGEIEIESFDQAVGQLCEAMNAIDNYREYLGSHIKADGWMEE